MQPMPVRRPFGRSPWEAEPEHQDYLELYPNRYHLPLRPSGPETAATRAGSGALS